VAGMILGMLGTIIVSIGDTILTAVTSCYREIKSFYNARRRRQDLEDSFTSAEKYGGYYEKLKN
jgi:hypothetical protein